MYFIGNNPKTNMIPQGSIDPQCTPEDPNLDRKCRPRIGLVIVVWTMRINTHRILNIMHMHAMSYYEGVADNAADDDCACVS